MAKGRSQSQNTASSSSGGGKAPGSDNRSGALTVQSSKDCFTLLRQYQQFSQEQRRLLIALAIVESKCNPMAHNKTTAEDSYGAFQINCANSDVRSEYLDKIKLSYDGFIDQCILALRYWETHTNPQDELLVRFGQWNGGRNIDKTKAMQLGSIYSLVHARALEDDYETLCKLSQSKVQPGLKSEQVVPKALEEDKPIAAIDWVDEFTKKQESEASHGDFPVTGVVVGSVVMLLFILTMTGVTQSVARVALAKMPSGGILRSLLEAIAKTGSLVRIKKKHTYCRFLNEMGVIKGYQSCIPLYDMLALKRRPVLVNVSNPELRLHVTDFDCKGAMFLEFKEYPKTRFYVASMSGNPYLSVEYWHFNLRAVPTLLEYDIEPQMSVRLPTQQELLIEYQSRKYAVDIDEVL